MQLKTRLIVCTLLFGFIFYCLFYHVADNQQTLNEPNNIRKHYLKQFKTILVWNDLFGRKNWGFNETPEVDFIRGGCPVTKCVVISDRARLVEADAVMFHLTLDDRPSLKLPHQRWVYLSHEPISLHPIKPYPKMINWVQSFRSDADIYMPYYSVCQRESPLKIDYQNILRHKKKLAAWFVSNCGASSDRDLYVRNLMKYVPVDVYGDCSIKFWQYNKCPRNGDCKRKLLETYKFYLSFENTLYRDYVTEKYFDILNLNVVPIVRGDANYSSVGPPRSYIDTKDFKSVKDLADYMLYLHQNDKEYIKYLKYKEQYVLEKCEIPNCKENTRPLCKETLSRSYCKLCEKLNNEKEPYHVYGNLQKWYGDARKADDIEEGPGILRVILDRILDIVL